MPKIPTSTATQGPGLLQLPTADPRSFGTQAGEGLSHFGTQLGHVANRLQQDQDQSDVLELSNQYKLRLATLPTQILNDPAIQPNDRTSAYQKAAEAYRQDLLKGVPTVDEQGMITSRRPVSSAAQRTFTNHAKSEQTDALIKFQAADIERRIQTRRADLTQEAEDAAATQATALAQGNGAAYLESQGTISHRLRHAEQVGIINPLERRAAEKQMVNRTFEMLAEQHPEKVIQMTDDIKAGKPGEYHGMDVGKATYYGNLAYNAIHQRELVLQREETRKEKYREMLAESTKQDYYQRWGLRNKIDEKVPDAPRYNTEQLLEMAAADNALGKHKDEVVTFLHSMLAHEQSLARQPKPVDWGFWTKTVLPSIYRGDYKNELDLIQQVSDRLAGHTDNAIQMFHTYQQSVTASIQQDYRFGHEYIKGLLGPLPGQTIDPLQQKELTAQSVDRFNTWYAVKVQEAREKGMEFWKTVDVQGMARKIASDDYQTMQDNLIRIMPLTEARLKYKSETEIKTAYADGKMAYREMTAALQELKNYQYMQTLAAKKLPTAEPKVGGRVEGK